MPATRKLRILTFSTLFPSSERPQHGIFVETRLRHLLASGEVEARVIAPVPWFPSQHARFGEYARMARTPAREQRQGLDAQYPRYLLPPKVGMSIAPFTMALGAASAVRRVLDEGFDFDVIDAHYYYPDGVAAALLARRFGRPFVITARGTDINLIPRYALPRRLIRWAAGRAHTSVGVCRALCDELQSLGADPERLLVLRNGVDLARFRPLDRSQVRARLGIAERPTLISVGYLIERKGHHLVIEALRGLESFQLLIVGSGPEQAALEALAHRTGVADRVRFVGSVPQQDLPAYYSAADILVLASSREGWANVLLESMACGTPVVATPIWGTPEVVAAPAAGRLAADRSSDALAQAIVALHRELPQRADVRAYAEQFSWAETTRGQLELFERITRESAASETARQVGAARA
jgi:glycosyltransferase involved in cell wall biosynthesis